jgi:hypothetical protein
MAVRRDMVTARMRFSARCGEHGCRYGRCETRRRLWLDYQHAADRRGARGAAGPPAFAAYATDAWAPVCRWRGPNGHRRQDQLIQTVSNTQEIWFAGRPGGGRLAVALRKGSVRWTGQLC